MRVRKPTDRQRMEQDSSADFADLREISEASRRHRCLESAQICGLHEHRSAAHGEDRELVQTARLHLSIGGIYGGLNGVWDYGPLGAELWMVRFASTPAMFACSSDGPRARTITFFGASPVIMKPPIIAPSPSGRYLGYGASGTFAKVPCNTSFASVSIMKTVRPLGRTKILKLGPSVTLMVPSQLSSTV